MQNVVSQMLAHYNCRSSDDYVRALREILQEIALLGLWRSKFFEKAAFYGGTALRILYGLDRFSEDLDFSLLNPLPGFDLAGYSAALEKELKAFGFDVRVEQKNKSVATPVQSAFLKADTVNQLLVIQADADIARQIPPGQVTRIKLEVDTDPPSGFATESRYLLQPLPFSVRSYTLPDLFAGKMHALLCRRWKNRVKGRDWYDLIWYCSHYPQLHLAHLEQRMRQSGHWSEEIPFTAIALREFLQQTIDQLNVDQARNEVLPFVSDPASLEIWSREFFSEIVQRIQCL